MRTITRCLMTTGTGFCTKSQAQAGQSIGKCLNTGICTKQAMLGTSPHQYKTARKCTQRMKTSGVGLGAGLRWNAPKGVLCTSVRSNITVVCTNAKFKAFARERYKHTRHTANAFIVLWQQRNQPKKSPMFNLYLIALYCMASITSSRQRFVQRTSLFMTFAISLSVCGSSHPMP